MPKAGCDTPWARLPEPRDHASKRVVLRSARRRDIVSALTAHVPPGFLGDALLRIGMAVIPRRHPGQGR